MNKIISTINFYDDCAYVENEPYEKIDIIEAIEKAKEDSTTKIQIKKNESERLNCYSFNFDDEIINIIIPKKYTDQNKQYIKLLDKWYSESRKQLIHTLKKQVLLQLLQQLGL